MTVRAPLYEPAPLDESIALSPEWLTVAFRQRRPEATVVDVEEVRRSQSSAIKVFVKLTFGDVRLAVDQFCIKAYFSRPEYAPVGAREVRFYEEIAPLAPIRVPTTYYTGVDSKTQHGIVIMDDLVAVGATPRKPGELADATQVTRSLDQLAGLHSRYWNDQLRHDPLMQPKYPSYSDSISDDELDELLAGPRGDGIPGHVRSARRLKSALRMYLRLDPERPSTFIHGDAHIGNMYLDADGTPGFIDWQNYEFGHWSLDVAYHIGAALDPEERRTAERELLRGYLARLRQGGVDLAEEEAWREYRSSMGYGYFLWAMTRRVEPAVTNEMNRRLGTAVADLDSFDILGV